MSVGEHKAQAPATVGCYILTVSDTRTLGSDTSGRAICELLAEAGHTVTGHAIVKDDPLTVAERVTLAIADDYEKYRIAFERPSFPKLRELVFVGPLTDEDAEDVPDDSDGLFLCQMIVRSPDAAHLERIEMPWVSIGYDACMTLVANREKLLRLKVLDLPHTSTVVRGYLRQEGMPLR